MMPPHQTLFAEARARLPLFDTLPEAAVDRLALGGFGSGLLTASLRTRLRKAGFAHMGALALATPADLMAVRKIGPVRIEGIRAHVLGELARLAPGARAAHDADATDQRRLDRLRAVAAEPMPLGGAPAERLGPAGATWADLALMPRAEAAQVLGVSAADLERLVSALVLALRPDPPRVEPVAAAREEDAARETRVARERAELRQEQDREWEEAAPVMGPGPLARRRAS